MACVSPTVPAGPPDEERHTACEDRSVTLPLIDLTEPFEEDGPDAPPVPPDEELTCVVCNLRRCELGILLKGDGRTVLWGLHKRCLPKVYAQHPAAPQGR